jgi:hypothetical protein
MVRTSVIGKNKLATIFRVRDVPSGRLYRRYMIPVTLDNTTHGELQRYENNYKALNLITTALGRNVYDRVAHLETAHDVWLKLYNNYEGSSEIKSSHKDTYNR